MRQCARERKIREEDWSSLCAQPFLEAYVGVVGGNGVSRFAGIGSDYFRKEGLQLLSVGRVPEAVTSVDEHHWRSFAVLVLGEGSGGVCDSLRALQDGNGDGLKRVFKPEIALLAQFLHRRQIESVLVREFFKDGHGLQAG